MKIILIFIFTFFFLNLVYAQNLKLNKNIKTDTLVVNLIQTDFNDTVLNKALSIQFDSLVDNFNKQGKKLVLKIDSTHLTNSISLTMEKIKYVSVNRSLLLTAFNLAMIGVNIIFFIAK